MLLHLLYDMFRFVEIVYLKVWWCLYHFLRMPALVAEFPFLEMVHVRKGTAGRAPDDEVHGNVVMCVILLNIYIGGFCPIQKTFFNDRKIHMQTVYRYIQGSYDVSHPFRGSLGRHAGQ